MRSRVRAINGLLTVVVRAALALFAVLLVTGHAAAEDRYGKQKVVYHINDADPRVQRAALTNIQNHIDAVGVDNLELKVVLHGDGLSLLLEPDSLPQLPKFSRANADLQMTARIDTLKGQGVRFAVCRKTLQARDAKQSDLYDVADEDVVPSGVAELAHLQGRGFAYVKP